MRFARVALVGLVLGLTAAAGSLVPLAVFFPGQLIASSALGLYAGVAVMVFGLILSSPNTSLNRFT